MKKIALVLVSAILLGVLGYWSFGSLTNTDPVAEVSESPAMQYKMKYEAEGKGSKEKKGMLSLNL